MSAAVRRASVVAPREQVGTFPLLNPKEIITVFQELLQRDLDPLILTEPLDQQKIRDLYQDIILVALDLAPDQIDTPARDAASVLEYQQLHNQSVSEINLWRQLYPSLALLIFILFLSDILNLVGSIGSRGAHFKSSSIPASSSTVFLLANVIALSDGLHCSSAFVQKIGITSFSYRDLYAPSYKRTRRVLSGIINFLKFSEEQMATYQEASIEIVRCPGFLSPPETFHFLLY